MVPLALIFVTCLALRRWSGLLGFGVGVLLVSLVAIGIPAHVNPGFAAEDGALRASDIAPQRPATIEGIVGIVRDTAYVHNFPRNGCDSLCLALLYSGRVSAVVMGDTIDASPDRAQLWTLVRGQEPCVIAYEPGVAVWQGVPDIHAALDRGLTGDCPLGRPAPMSAATLIVEQMVIGPRLSVSEETDVLNPPASGTRLSLWRRGPKGRSLIARQTHLIERRLKQPLHFTIGGDAFSGPHSIVARAPRQGDLLPRVDRFIDLRGVKVKSASPAASRAALDAWLSDHARKDSKLHSRLWSMAVSLMKGETREAGDLDRYRRLILDPRENEGIVRRAVEAFPEDSQLLLDTTLARIAAMPADTNDLYGYGRELESFPARAFAAPPPRLIDLLRAAPRADRMAGVIARLADGGPAAAPLLLRQFEQSLPPRTDATGRAFNGRAAIGALDGLCRIGAPAGQYLRRIEQLVASNSVLSHRLVEYDPLHWAVIRVRMGKPFDTILSPADAPKDWRTWVNRQVVEGRCQPS